MKKIYFSYSDKPEDQSLYKDLNNHLQQYKRKGWIEIYDEQELFKQNGDLTKNEEFLNYSYTKHLILFDNSIHQVARLLFLRNHDWFWLKKAHPV